MNTEPFPENSNEIIQLCHIFSLIKVQHKYKKSYVVERSGKERDEIHSKTAYSTLSNIHEIYDKVCSNNELTNPYIRYFSLFY